MAELRYNPLLGTWTMVASHRQNRPQMPKNWCPFCPGSGKVPEKYDVYKYDNDFPALSTNPPVPDDVGSDFYKTAPAYGACEVILYSPEHTKTLHELPVTHIRKLVDLWAERITALSATKTTKYVMPFENKGEEVGVTMPHPHGQIYAYSWIPQKVQVELDNARAHHKKTGECLICRMNAEEEKFAKRIVYENGSFVAYIPFFTDYPYGVFVTAKNHRNYLAELDDAERNDLAEILKVVTAAFDKIFDRPFPYMMVLAPESGEQPGVRRRESRLSSPLRVLYAAARQAADQILRFVRVGRMGRGKRRRRREDLRRGALREARCPRRVRYRAPSQGTSEGIPRRVRRRFFVRRGVRVARAHQHHRRAYRLQWRPRFPPRRSTNTST